MNPFRKITSCGVPSTGLTPIDLPAPYDDLSPRDRKIVRERYQQLQDGCCWHCGNPLDENPATHILDAKINWGLFPRNFQDHPIHLHHDHVSGLTIGAIHMRCNAWLWDYCGQ